MLLMLSIHQESGVLNRKRGLNSSVSPVAPTSFQNKPFGEYVEGLSHFRAKGYAVELEVQTDDFENLTFRLKIRTSPFLFKTL